MSEGAVGSMQVLEHSVTLPATAEAVYAWHQRSGALERLMPPWEHVRVLERSGGIADGARTVLSIPLGPFSVRWVARHRNTIAGRQFVDEQTVGPFAHWVHLHRMIDRDDGASSLLERVEFEPPFGPLGAIATPALRRRVGRMLRYRHEVLRDDFAQPFPDRPLTIAVTGATGFIGRHLLPVLTTAGHTVRRVVRSHPQEGDIVWSPATGELDARQLEGVDAVIHLAGENIAGGRWSAARKARIRRSRVDGTALLARTLARLARKPSVLVSMSATGYYGTQRTEALDESSGPGDDFLAQVCVEWEASADPAREAGIRVVHPRPGLVLSPAGGALPRLALPVKLGAGGPLGSGQQWVSWIALDDVLGAIRHAVEHDALSGPVNLVAPEPVRNRALVTALGRLFHRPTVLPVPAPLLRAILGEMADALLLSSQQVQPLALRESGYAFRYPTLEEALKHLYGR